MGASPRGTAAGSIARQIRQVHQVSLATAGGQMSRGTMGTGTGVSREMDLQAVLIRIASGFRGNVIGVDIE